MELLVDLKDEDPSPMLPENTESRKLVSRKKGLIPPSLEVLPEISQRQRVWTPYRVNFLSHSLKRWGGGRNTHLLSLPVKLTGSTIHSPPS